jgi:hypothetical protein
VTRDGVHEVYRLRIVVREYECKSERENSVEMSREWGSGAEICLKMCGRKQGRRCCQEEEEEEEEAKRRNGSEGGKEEEQQQGALLLLPSSSLPKRKAPNNNSAPR